MIKRLVAWWANRKLAKSTLRTALEMGAIRERLEAVLDTEARLKSYLGSTPHSEVDAALKVVRDMVHHYAGEYCKYARKLKMLE